MSYKILVVDDSRSMRNVIKKMLRILGIEAGNILEAGNGVQALEVLEQEWVDLVLSDVHMPEMDGLELLRLLRKNEDLGDLPVVLITTETNEDHLAEAFSLGVKGYLRKPFQPEALQALLVQILGGSLDEQQLAGSDEECDF